MSSQLAGNFTNSEVDTIEAVFTATESTTIDSFTVSNNSGVNASYAAYITASGGSDVAQIPFKIVVWGENDLGIGVVNQTIPAGGSLKVESSATSSLYFTVTGRELS